MNQEAWMHHDRQGLPEVLKHAGFILCILAIPAAALAPLFVSAYVVRTLADLFFFLVLTCCFNILGGRSGYLNLGQGVLVGTGAYATGFFVRVGLNPWQALTGAVSLAIPLGFFLAWALFRLRDEAFALATLALLYIFLSLAGQWRSITGGTDGLYLMAGGDSQAALYGQLLMAILVITCSLILEWRRTGYHVKVMGEDLFLAESMGIPTRRVMIKLYMFCTVCLSLSGGIFMLGQGYIIPETVFGLKLSLLPVAMAMAGGLGSPMGAVRGALLVFGVQEWLWVYVGSMEQSLLGLMLIIAGRRAAIVQGVKKLFQ